MLGLFRNKTILVLIVLLILGTAVGTAQNRARDAGEPLTVASVVRVILMPVQAGARGVGDAADWAVGLFRPRGKILRENARLRKEVRQLSVEAARLREAAEENIRLRQALELKKSSPYKMISAEILSRKGSGWFDTATLDRGRSSGVLRGSAVTSYRGLVGQVVEADALTSQVVALTDASSAVGATLQRSRISGIVQGQGADYLVLAYLAKDADVKEGDIVVSSGMGKVVPKGLPIGRVVKVVRNSFAGTTSALVRPSVRLEQVEQVFVVAPGQGTAQ